MPLLRPVVKIAALLAGLALVISACTQTRQAICPRVAILAQAAKLTKFAPGQETPQNVEWAGEMTGIKVKCSYTDSNYRTMEADVTVDMILRKGPAMRGDTVSFNYFVVVTDRRGNVLNKRVFPSTVSLGGANAVTRSEISWQLYDLQRSLSGAAYEIWVGYQLTQNQLQYNRKTE